jgi:4,4'-diaponeurosporenoate glycosyltransferase
MSGGTAALLAAGWMLGWVLAGRRHTLTDRALPAQVRVSVVIPARDEAARLPRLLEALAAASPPPHEVLVVDDGSTDGTPVLAHAGGATVIATADRPAGWGGKAYACHRGAQAATGDVLVFLDADVEPAATGVAALAAAAIDTGGLVSAHPVQRVERPYERLSAGPGLVALLGAGTGGRPARRWWRRPFAFGPALAVPVQAYRRIGGHDGVRTAIAEDVALATAAERRGLPVRALVAGRLFAYRMYPGGPAQLVEGWTKNLATGGAAAPPVRTAAVAVWVTAALRSGLAVVGGVAGGLGGASGTPLAAVAAYLLFAVQFHVLGRRIGRFGLATSAAYPLLLGAFVALFAWSVALTYGWGRVRWRGRTVDLRRAP